MKLYFKFLIIIIIVFIQSCGGYFISRRRDSSPIPPDFCKITENRSRVPFANSNEADGETIDNSFIICTSQQLASISNNPDYLGKYFILGDDLDLSIFSGNDFTMIGDDDNPFLGYFDGNNKTISNLTYNDTSENIALFKKIDLFATIKNINIENFNINANRGACLVLTTPNVYNPDRDITIDNINIKNSTLLGDRVASLAHFIENASITNIYINNVNLTGNNSTSGLIGWSDKSNFNNVNMTNITVNCDDGYGYCGGVFGGDYRSIFNNIFIESKVSCNDTTAVSGSCGGFIGYLDASGEISNIIVSTDLTSNKDAIGGFAGRVNYGHTLENIFVTGNITGNSFVGGIVGGELSPTRKINNIFNGTITATGDYVGGISGIAYSFIRYYEVYSLGEISGNNNVGGLLGGIGGSFLEIKNSYTISNITGNSNVAGLIGSMNRGQYSSIPIIQNNAFFEGSINGTSNVAGIVGSYIRSDGICDVSEFKNNYWNNNYNGPAIATCNGTPINSTVNKYQLKSSAELKDQNTFNEWDFENIWHIIDSYPFFRN